MTRRQTRNTPVCIQTPAATLSVTAVFSSCALVRLQPVTVTGQDKIHSYVVVHSYAYTDAVPLVWLHHLGQGPVYPQATVEDSYSSTAAKLCRGAPVAADAAPSQSPQWIHAGYGFSAGHVPQPILPCHNLQTQQPLLLSFTNSHESSTSPLHAAPRCPEPPRGAAADDSAKHLKLIRRDLLVAQAVLSCTIALQCITLPLACWARRIGESTHTSSREPLLPDLAALRGPLRPPRLLLPSRAASAEDYGLIL